MGLGESIVQAVRAYQERKQRFTPGAIGRFHRDGGNELLYDIPVRPGELVIDAGGYRGEWSMRVLARYGCRLVILEPIPAFVDRLMVLYAANPAVSIRAAALGGTDGTTTLHLHGDGTSSFRPDAGPSHEARLVDIASLLAEAGGSEVACLKLNIEGGEYDVLERLLEIGLVARCRSLLVQFHRQPAGWESRLARIEEVLRRTHTRVWHYPMVWEKWIRKDPEEARACS